MANESLDGLQIKVGSIPVDRLQGDGVTPPESIGAAELDGADIIAMRAKLQVDVQRGKTNDIASTSTLQLQALALAGDFTDVTGTTTVTAIILNTGREHTVRFLGALTLTHNASTLILPGAVNYTTAAGDVLRFRGITGGVVCVGVTRAAGVPPLSAAYTSSPAVITSAGSTSFTHLLGGTPTILQLSLVCVTAEAGYSIADVVAISAGSASNRGVSATLTSTAVVVRFGSDANAFQVAHKTTGVTTALTNANWNLVVRAWL